MILYDGYVEKSVWWLVEIVNFQNEILVSWFQMMIISVLDNFFCDFVVKILK